MEKIQWKSVLLGTGLGMIITCATSIIYLAGSLPVSDTEIEKKARNLGMKYEKEWQEESGLLALDDAGADTASEKESTLSADIPSTDSPSVDTTTQENAGEKESVSDKTVQTSDPVQEGAVPEGTVPENTVQESTPPENTVPAKTETIRFRVEHNESAQAVAKNLKSVNLIQDEKQFITKLCNLKLQYKVRTGEYDLVPGATEEQLIATLTRTKIASNE